MLNLFSYINIRRISAFIVTIFLISGSCTKDQNGYIPNVPDFSIELDMTSDLGNLGVGQLVTITPNKTQPDYSDLNFHSSKIKNITIPFQCYGNGLVLCKGFDNEYKVYDLTCPYNASTEYRAVTIKSNDLAENCVCEFCKSEFLLYDNGKPKSGSLAVKPLLQYKVSIISYNSRMLISK